MLHINYTKYAMGKKQNIIDTLVSKDVTVIHCDSSSLLTNSFVISNEEYYKKILLMRSKCFLKWNSLTLTKLRIHLYCSTNPPSYNNSISLERFYRLWI